MSIKIQFEFEDHTLLWDVAHSMTKSVNSIKPNQFSFFDPAVEKDSVIPEMVLLSQDFKNGSILYCNAASDALLLKKIHVAAGYKAFIMKDSLSQGSLAVLTSWDCMGNLPELTEREIFIEVSLEPVLQYESETALVDRKVKEIIESNGGVIVGDSNSDSQNHEDHLHYSHQLTLKIAGTSIEKLAIELSANLNVPARWRIVDNGAF